MPVAETVAWEHSEPGTGPTPVYGDPGADKAIKNGWRVDSPPAAFPGHEDPFLEKYLDLTFQLPYEAEEGG